MKKTLTRRKLTPEMLMSYKDMCAKVLLPYRVGDSPVSNIS